MNAEKPLAIWDMQTDRERECFRAGLEAARAQIAEENKEWIDMPIMRSTATYRDYIVSSARLIPVEGGDAVEVDFRQLPKMFRRMP